MKRLIILLLLVLMMVSVAPAHTTDESYYLYPAINYVGDSADLPAGEMVEWTVECTIFFKGIEVQEMVPSMGNTLDADKCTIQSFTLSEMFGIHITYTIYVFIRSSIEYLWNGQLNVDEQTIEEYDHDYWVQYRCLDISDDWLMELYAATSGDIRTTDNGILMLLALLSLGIVVVMTEKGYHWLVKRGKEEE